MAGRAAPRWSGPAEVAARVRREWDSGRLLAAYGAGADFPVIDLPLRAPRPGEMGERLGEVQEWATALDAASRDGAAFDLVWGEVGGRLIGRNRIPRRASVEAYAQAWRLLAVGSEVRRFDAVLAEVAPDPPARAWVLAHPLRALALAEEWPRLLAAHRWLRLARGSGRYVREIEASGVDTKFVERHRGVLAALLEVPATSGGFLAGLGLAARPVLVRLRLGAGVRPVPGLTEVAVRPGEAEALGLAPSRVLVVENEITYLSLPVPPDGVVVWGSGYDVDRIGALPFLGAAEVFYWGDLDTHGFAILNRLRHWAPHARSVLMDEGTLLAHRDRWVVEPQPTSAILDRLTDDEDELYRALVSDRHGDRVRLEQERVAWRWVLERLPG